MKKFLLISAGIIILLLFITFIAALIISFKLVKQTTELINGDLKNNFGVVVRIPKEARPTYKSFSTTVYSWDMETNQNEVTTVIFKHDTGFSESQNTIKASLEMTQTGDPSLFNKVLPAVISDKQSLFSAQNRDKPKLDPNPDVGYKKIDIYAYEGNTQHVSKISWEFDRDNIGKSTLPLYEKLQSHKEWQIRALYSLQSFTLKILSP